MISIGGVSPGLRWTLVLDSIDVLSAHTRRCLVTLGAAGSGRVSSPPLSSWVRGQAWEEIIKFSVAATFECSLFVIFWFNLQYFRTAFDYSVPEREDLQAGGSQVSSTNLRVLEMYKLQEQLYPSTLALLSFSSVELIRTTQADIKISSKVWLNVMITSFYS